MTKLEARLRRDLPRLVDMLTETSGEIAPDDGAKRAAPTSATAGPTWPRERAEVHGRRRRQVLVGATAALLIMVGGVIVVGNRSGDIGTRVDTSAAAQVLPPTSWGTWRELPAAPIGPRAHAVSAWTGSEVVFWAGSNLMRNFAFTDGAAYDPLTGSWRELIVPGWGHPGLTSTYYDGELYLWAKGFGSRFDPVDGSETDLPPIDDAYGAVTVAADGSVWTLGPARNDSGHPSLAIHRYEPDDNAWTPGAVYEGSSERAETVQGVTLLENPALWTGTEIVVWDRQTGGLAYDPSRDVWREIVLPSSPRGAVSETIATVTGFGLTIVAKVQTDSGSILGVATLADDEWLWREPGSAHPELPAGDFATASATGAGDWVVLFGAEAGPITIHVPSGAWRRLDDGPLGGVVAPNLVWTGSELVVWGGVGSPTATVAEPADGAIWTPPSP